MSNITQLFEDLESGHYEDIDIYLNSAIEEFNYIFTGLLQIDQIMSSGKILNNTEIVSIKQHIEDILSKCVNKL